MMHSAWPGTTFGGMQALGRWADGDQGIIVDAGLGIAAAGLIAVAAWGSPRLIGSEAIAGPAWLLALLPLLLGGPLVLRRRAPLPMWAAIWATIALQSPFTLDPRHVLRYGRARRRPNPSYSRYSSAPTRWARTPACAARRLACSPPPWS